jgi:hypothetical protein
MEMDGTPIRDASKVLECGLSYFIVWRRRKKTELSHPVGVICRVRQEVSALKLFGLPDRCPIWAIL